jgi:hypothetical protein
MIGEPRQERAARNVGDCPGIVVEPAFFADIGADVGDRRVVAAAGEVEKDAVAGKILDVRGFKVLDRREVAAIEQGDLVVVRAHMHPALIGADRGGDVVRSRAGRRFGARWIEVAWMLAIAVHVRRPTPFDLEQNRPARLRKR